MPVGEIAAGLLPRLNSKTLEVELQRSGGHSERLLKIITWTEAATQITLDDTQRSILLDEMVRSDLPPEILGGAAYVIAMGHINTYSKLNMAVWREAAKELVRQVGQLNRFFHGGWREGYRQAWQEIEQGLHDDKLRARYG